MAATYYVLVLVGAAYGATPEPFPERFKTEAACRAVGERWSFPYRFEPMPSEPPFVGPTHIPPRYRCIKMYAPDGGG